MKQLKSTLNELIESINANLKDIIGKNVGSKLDVCKTVREIIKENEFYKMLEQNGLNDVLVFKDDIENMPFIFLHISGNENLKKIIEIIIRINYYDEIDYQKGGILDDVQCSAIDIGEKIKDIPLSQVVSVLKLKDISSKKHEVENKIKELNNELETLKAKFMSYSEEEAKINLELEQLNIQK